MAGVVVPRRARAVALVVALVAALLGWWTTEARAAPGEAPPQAVLYFFWGEGCPHCAAAKPVLAEMQARTPGLVVRPYEVFNDAANRQLFADLAARQGFEPGGVPTFVLGERHWVGYAEGRTGPELERAVAACLVTGCADAGAGLVAPLPTSPAAAPGSASQPPASAVPPGGAVLDLPLLGRVDLAQQPLVVTTVLIAAVDGFNPCSLWVLTILLALALRTGSRRFTLLIGLVFITVTALVYALFIAGIFSLLSVLTIAPWVRVAVALIAAAFALVNIKDYFWFRQGVSLTIPDARKPGLYARMRGIIARTDSVPAMVAGTAALAAGVSLVELACTAGFPMVWTNILAAQQVGAATFVALLAVYMVVYQLDELLIFGAAVVTLRASRLEEKHGRVLKLVSGMLMLALAVAMIVDPAAMTGLGSSLAVFGAALLATVAVLLAHRVVLPRLGVRIGSQRRR